MGAPVVWDPFEAATVEDPYPVYARLRADDPFHVTPWGTLALSRHADVLAALHDPHLGNDPRRSDEYRLLLEQPLIADAAKDFEQAGFMLRDPPEHTCRRATVSRAFTRASVDRWHDSLAILVAALVDQVVPRGHIDVVAELGPALQTAVMGEILGLPPKGIGQLRDWRLTSLAMKDRAMAEAAAAHAEGRDAAPEVWADRQAARREVLAYLGRRIDHRRGNPQADLLSMLAATPDVAAGGELDTADLALVAEQVFVAGFETTAALLGNAVAAALAHPPAWEAMGAGELDPDLVVAETLRWDSPVQVVSRYALAPTEVGGRAIAAGAHVHLLVASANHDLPGRADPERFDPPSVDAGAGAGGDGVAFGHGRHRCLAAHLARREVALVLGELSRRVPDLRLEPGASRRPDLVLRSHRRLVASWSGRPKPTAVTGSIPRETAGQTDP